MVAAKRELDVQFPSRYSKLKAVKIEPKDGATPKVRPAPAPAKGVPPLRKAIKIEGPPKGVKIEAAPPRVKTEGLCPSLDDL